MKQWFACDLYIKDSIRGIHAKVFVSFLLPKIHRLHIDLFSSVLYSICFAKHVQDKAAKWARAKRPRKSRPSDINRAPIIYALHSYAKPAEYTISDEPAVLAVKPSGK
jgi:hypothetical protein